METKMMEGKLASSRKMFKHACAFAECAYFCEKDPSPIKKRTQWHTVPNIVNSVFACEIYIKSLLVYYGMTLTEIRRLNHGLVNLWEEVRKRDPSFSNMIEKAIKENFNSSNESLFDEMLEYISEAFKTWRYIYEGYEVKINRNFLILLRNYLRDGCCCKYYNKSWNEFVENQCSWDISEE